MSSTAGLPVLLNQPTNLYVSHFLHQIFFTAKSGELCGDAETEADVTNDQPSKAKRGLECPSCGWRHLYVLYARHRANTIIRARVCRHCQRRIVTHDRVIGS